jgi:hypothetical protein
MSSRTSWPGRSNSFYCNAPASQDVIFFFFFQKNIKIKFHPKKKKSLFSGSQQGTMLLYWVLGDMDVVEKMVTSMTKVKKALRDEVRVEARGFMSDLQMLALRAEVWATLGITTAVKVTDAMVKARMWGVFLFMRDSRPRNHTRRPAMIQYTLLYDTPPRDTKYTKNTPKKYLFFFTYAKKQKKKAGKN